MPFSGPITMSLATAKSPVTHTSAVNSPTKWSIFAISTPGPIGLRKGRWTFDVQAVAGNAGGAI